MTQETYMDFFKKSTSTGKKLRMLARSNLSKIGYTFEEFDILRSITDESPVNASELAENTGRHKSNVVPILNSFEEKGYIIRSKDKTDRRNVWITLSVNGIKEKKRVLEFQKEYISRLLGGISDDIIEGMLSSYRIIHEYLNDIISKDGI